MVAPQIAPKLQMDRRRIVAARTGFLIRVGIMSAQPVGMNVLQSQSWIFAAVMDW